MTGVWSAEPEFTVGPRLTGADQSENRCAPAGETNVSANATACNPVHSAAKLNLQLSFRICPPIGQPGRLYFDLTMLVADPHRLLTTLTFCGFTGHESCPLYLPSPRFRNVPINSADDVTLTRSVAVEPVLLAATRNSCLLA